MAEIKRCIDPNAAAGSPAKWMPVLKSFTPIDAWPVGSVFIGITATNPATLLGGGSWTAFGTGKMLIGRDSADTTMDTAEEVGGTKTHTLAIGNIPSHTHDIDHNHASFNTGNSPSMSHQHTMDHNHATATTSAGGAHGHVLEIQNGSTVGNVLRPPASTSSGVTTPAGGGVLAGAAAHTHTVDLPTLGTTTLSGTGNLAVHVHSVDMPLSVGLVSGATGSATPTAINHLPPFIVVYMWKRTA